MAGEPGVPRDAAEAVRMGMEAFNRRDLDAALAAFDPEIEWIVGPELGPDAGTYRGHAGVREFWQAWFDSVEGFRMDIEECVERVAGRVLVTTRVHGSGAGSGVPVEARIHQVLDIEDGTVTRVRIFGRRDEAAAAASQAPDRSGLPPR